MDEVEVGCPHCAGTGWMRWRDPETGLIHKAVCDVCDGRGGFPPDQGDVDDPPKTKAVP